MATGVVVVVLFLLAKADQSRLLFSDDEILLQASKFGLMFGGEILLQAGKFNLLFHRERIVP